jgi:hypothetical protein
MKNNPYRLLGLGLVIAGALFVPVAYFIISSIPLAPELEGYYPQFPLCYLPVL